MSDAPQTNSTEKEAPAETSGASEVFTQEAEEKARGIVGEFIDFMLHNKKWWLMPIIVILLIFGVLVLISGTAAAPFIYTLF